ncbi:hypothetical protein EHP00_787 [Ecytonucleospora hepatopenaei]|uniref:Uncharacterized protein n=1 Tax=Ecytonucleospora hepatopenaei TaxID=646526 RepID=A0A1W0E7U1_9MICR|nr:hypothetical protein EHP00_787 [Ecytonucleospora hepatopenaei]
MEKEQQIIYSSMFKVLLNLENGTLLWLLLSFLVLLFYIALFMYYMSRRKKIKQRNKIQNIVKSGDMSILDV